MTDSHLTLRSYRLVFQLQRRIHRIDRYRLPLPYGLPLAGAGCAFALLLVVAGASRLPIIGAILALLPWPLHWVVIPVAGAQLLSRTTADGRPFHEALRHRLVAQIRPRRLAGVESLPRTIDPRALRVTIAPDESAVVYRAGTVSGPATVILRQPARLEPRRQSAVLRPLEDRPMLRPRELVLDDGQRLVIA